MKIQKKQHFLEMKKKLKQQIEINKMKIEYERIKEIVNQFFIIFNIKSSLLYYLIIIFFTFDKVKVLYIRNSIFELYKFYI